MLRFQHITLSMLSPQQFAYIALLIGVVKNPHLILTTAVLQAPGLPLQNLEYSSIQFKSKKLNLWEREG